jgi:hypothetical protein
MSVDEDFWRKLHELLTRLYPLGPHEEHVWERAGGDPARLLSGVTARAAWFDAVSLLQNGGGGATVQALLREVSADYPYNVEVRTLAALQPLKGTGFEPTLSRPGFRALADRLFPRAHLYLTQIGTLPEPDEFPDISGYLRDLGDMIRHDLNDRIYIPPVAKSVDPKHTRPYHQEPAADEFLAPISRVLRQFVEPSEGGSSESAQIAALNRRSKSVRNILRLLNRTAHPLVLLGEPGSGKTMTLQQAVVALTMEERRHVFPRVPAYVRLGEFHVQTKTPAVNDVRELVARSLPLSLQPWFGALEREGRMVVFFDGMDEMSRERYGEHIEALSRYAGSAPFPTLFSCRIADFSHRFIHQRLVILPFDISQVTAYLRAFLAAPQIEIERQRWGLRKLAQHIGRGRLPVEATNPFVLWLLCLYLVHRGTWPASWVEMLQYYHEQNYDRKSGEREDDEPPFPPRARAFAAWARFAYLITERNRGAGIPYALLQECVDGGDVAEAVRVGTRCGVLEQSRAGDGEHLVRFAHQRFQEFFAAWHVHAERPRVDWLGKLDAPRWQETMFNLILMGGAMDVVALLGRAITDQLQECRADLERAATARNAAAATADAAAASVDGTPEPVDIGEGEDANEEKDEEVDENQGGDENVDRPDEKAGDGAGKDEASALSDELETALADRIELSSRIMHQAGSGSPHVRDALMPSFTEGVALLASHGTPITQVKMLRACQNVRGTFLKELEKPLSSDVRWVREQALVLIASGQATGAAIGSDFATEVGIDFANGMLATRPQAYWRAARAAGGLRTWWAVVASVSCYLAYAGALTMLAVGIFLALPWVGSELAVTSPKLSYLATPAARGAAALLFVAAVGVMARLDPRRLWFAILAAPLAAGVVVPTVARLATGSWDEVFNLFWLVVVGFGVFGVGTLAAAPLHFACLAAYLAVTSRLRRSNRGVRVFFATAWRSCGYGSGFRVLLWELGLAAVVGAVWCLGWLIDTLLSAGSESPLTSGWSALVLCGIVGFLGMLVAGRVRSAWIPAWKARWISGAARVLLDVAGCAGAVAGLVGIFALLFVLSEVAEWIEARVYDLSGMYVEWWIPTLGGSAIVVAAWMLGREWSTRGFAATRALAAKFLAGVLALAAVIGVILVVSYIVGEIWQPLAHRVAQGVGKLLWLLCMALPFIVLWSWWSRTLRWRFRRRERLPHRAFTPDTWKARMRGLGPAQQKDLLYQTDHQTLGLGEEREFLPVLREIRPWIKAEPALSAYWAQRSQLEESLRQERRG